MMRRVRARGWAATIGVLAGLLLTVAWLLGYAPGDAAGATSRKSTMQTSAISLALAVLALLPLGRFRWMLVGGAGAFLVLSLTFYLIR